MAKVDLVLVWVTHLQVRQEWVSSWRIHLKIIALPGGSI